MEPFYDTHAHLDYPEFADDLPQVLERARAAGIRYIISIGTDFSSSEHAIKLAELNPMVYAAVGWHPSQVLEAPDDVRPRLRELAQHPKVVAIGETGLDYHRLPSGQTASPTDEDREYQGKQRRLFEQQLEVALESKLNCVIHQRDSFEDVARFFQPFAGRVQGQFHCFVNGPADMERILAIGCVPTFTGIVTFKSAETVRRTVAATPLGKFFLETDSPFLAPVPFRGRRCEPAYVKEISETVAQIKGVSLEALSKATCETAHQFFPKLPR